MHTIYTAVKPHLKKIGLGQIIVASLLYASPTSAQSKSPTLHTATMTNLSTFASVKSVVIINQRLNSVLEEFAHRQGLALKMSKKLKTRVRSKKLPVAQKPFLKELSKQFSIDWYKIGNELFISPKKDRVTRLVSIGTISPKDIKSDIDRVIVNAQSFSFSSIKGSKSVLLSGPPTYVAFVELIVKGTLKNRKRALQIRLYKGGYEVVRPIN